MNWRRGFGSSIGTKYLMALTGLILTLFTIGHMLGNFSVYRGRDAMNSYAATLQGLGGLLWIARIGLLAVLLAHLKCAFQLTRENRDARPVGYSQQGWPQSSTASRTMILTGLVILAFIVYHLLHFTLGVTDPASFNLEDPEGRHDVYRMFVLGFQKWPVTAAYVVAMLLLGMHLWHGVNSMFQSMGWTRLRYRRLVRSIGYTITAALVVGNISMPLACLFGILKVPEATP